MRRDQLYKLVSTAIANRKPSGSGKWFLCYWKDKIVARPTTVIPNPDVIFYTLNELQATHGFVGSEWNEIFSAICKFFTQKGLL